MQRRLPAFLLCLLLRAFEGAAQDNELPSTVLSLQNLNDFKPVGSNWKIVGAVFYDLRQAGKGRTQPGTGVVVNDPSGKSKDHLLTTMEHGDLALELDFMVDKGANAGVYLQGRYEIQLFDSWGVPRPTAADCGAIYQRWDESRPEGQKGYEGHPPAQNVSRAPGLWQHCQIHFRAPRFNAKGEKVENARFVKVVQNGVTIHENVEVTGPTRAAAFEDEKPLGPLMIQGDHGPVALRAIRYKAYGTEPVVWSGMKLTTYEGKFNAVADFAALTPKMSTDLDVLEHPASGNRDNFGGKITGTLRLPRSGPYLLSLNLKWIPSETNPAKPNGAGELMIGNRKILAIDGKAGGVATTTVDLEAGDHPVVLSYYKNFGLWYARSNDIALSVEGPGVARTALNAPVRAAEPVGAITVVTRNEPVMLRSFINHRGQKKTHVISVGEPGAANYTVDLRQGSVLQIWRGDFLETTPMWHNRGETQLAVPLGSVVEFPAQPSLAFLADQNAAWPDSNATYNYLGYEVKAGRPVFKYALGAAQVRESLRPEEGGRKLAHSFTVNPGGETKSVWCRVAEGSNITKLPNGLYAVGDQQYFVELPDNEEPVIRNTAQNTKELLLPVKAKNNVGTVTYSIIW
ncbi:MAG: DUF1080 domain-containing protein [Ferruginibacter sp.]|nr:DUF1080 domain-containing protein [Cytophagales bacterium]